MVHKIAILGGSLGGLVAATELSAHGFSVEIIEKGCNVGGLYSEVKTPFGDHELGMHVVYVNQIQYEYLSRIFGIDSFHNFSGTFVDRGASINRGDIYLNSHYPSLLTHPLREKILKEIVSESCSNKIISLNAEDELRKRFGNIASREIVSPILEKLWGIDPCLLTKESLNCYYDLRRLVIVEKKQADILKDSPILDGIIANPIQEDPKGEVFEGRIGLLFKRGSTRIATSVHEWSIRSRVKIHYGCDVRVAQGHLYVNDELLNSKYDACISTVPIHTLASNFSYECSQADKVELSLYYFQLNESLKTFFSPYYLVAHDPQYFSSRLVNYDGYHPSGIHSSPSVISVEAVHMPTAPPSITRIQEEVSSMFPGIRIVNSYKIPSSLSLYSPTINNSFLLNKFESSIASAFNKPIYFAGMRTDTGNFFSHHTIGLAHEKALDCIRQFS